MRATAYSRSATIVLLATLLFLGGIAPTLDSRAGPLNVPATGMGQIPNGPPGTTFSYPVAFVLAPTDWLEVSPGALLGTPRLLHTATRLHDDRVLLVGGSRSASEFMVDVDIFDPATGQITQVAPLHTPRHQHTATILEDGRVLVVGGYNAPQGWLADAEVYDPVANTWTVVPTLYPHGVGHTATRTHGRVLVVGGAIGDGLLSDRAEIFDPQTNTWAAAAPLASVRAGHTAQALNDGRVLVAGGFGYGDIPPASGDALLYDLQADTWTATGPMVEPRAQGESVLLWDGRVLVAGGLTVPEHAMPKITSKAEIFSPASNAWTAAPDLARARYCHRLVIVPYGQVLAIGGVSEYSDDWTEASFVREIDRYDPATGQWRIAGGLPQPRALAAAIMLTDYRVWLSGGQSTTTYFSETWLLRLHTPLPLGAQ